MIGQKQLAQRMMQQVDLSDTNVVQALVIGLSQIEHAQAQALRECAHTHDFTEHIDIQIPDPDARQEFLIDAISAIQDGDIIEWWIDNATPVDNATTAQEYAGLSESEWNQQQSDWYSEYEAKAPEFAETKDKREVSNHHIISQFGVEIGDFEDFVVAVGREDIIRKLLAGNLESIERQLRQAANADTETAKEEDTE